MDCIAAIVRGPTIDAGDLDFLGTASATKASVFDEALLDGELGIAIEALERTMLKRAIDACSGNKAEAARRLGIHRQLLYRKLKQYDIE